MSATIVVFDHPWFAVPDETGAFDLTGVPPGEHQVTAWHERLGETTFRCASSRDARPRSTSSCRSRAAVRTPPRLVARTLGVTFVTVAVILSLVFLVLTLDTGDRVPRRGNREAAGQRADVHGARGATPAGSARLDPDARREPDAQGGARHLRHRAGILAASPPSRSGRCARPSSARRRSWPRITRARCPRDRRHRAAASSRARAACASAGPRVRRCAPGRTRADRAWRRRGPGRGVPRIRRGAEPRTTAMSACCSSAPASTPATRRDCRTCRTPGSSSPSTARRWRARSRRR